MEFLTIFSAAYTGAAFAAFLIFMFLIKKEDRKKYPPVVMAVMWPAVVFIILKYMILFLVDRFVIWRHHKITGPAAKLPKDIAELTRLYLKLFREDETTREAIEEISEYINSDMDDARKVRYIQLELTRYYELRAEMNKPATSEPGPREQPELRPQ